MVTAKSTPGQRLILEDNFSKQKQTSFQPTGPSILLIGTATDGRKNELIKALNPENAYSILGDVKKENGAYNGATLLPAFEQAWNAGFRNIMAWRFNGVYAKGELAGTPQVFTKNKVKEETVLVKGNVAKTFTLPHGGIVAGSVQVKVNDVIIGATKYTVSLGTPEDKQAGTPGTKATLDLNADVVTADSVVVVSYQYGYTDTDGSAKTAPHETSKDDTGATMFALGQDEVYLLAETPTANLRVYNGDLELALLTHYTVNAATKQLTLKKGHQIKKGSVLTVRYEYVETKTVTPKILVEGYGAGSIYNNVKLEVKQDPITGTKIVLITKPLQKREIATELPLEYHSDDFATLGQLAAAVNATLKNNVVQFIVSEQDKDIPTNNLAITPAFALTGGDDELNLSKEQLFNLLSGIKSSEGAIIVDGVYQKIINIETDYVMPLGVYFDDELVDRKANFDYELAQVCAVMSEMTNLTQGVIEAAPPTSLTVTEIDNWYKRLLARNVPLYLRDELNNIVESGTGERMDIGKFIARVASPEPVVANARLGNIAGSAAIEFLGTVVKLKGGASPISRPVPSALGLRFTLNGKQIEELTKAKYIVLRNNTAGTTVIVDAPTGAVAESQYTRFNTMKIIKEVMRRITRVTDELVSLVNSDKQIASVTATISRVLREMTEGDDPLLVGYSFEIINSPQAALIGDLSIEYTFTVAREIKQITHRVSIK